MAEMEYPNSVPVGEDNELWGQLFNYDFEKVMLLYSFTCDTLEEEFGSEAFADLDRKTHRIIGSLMHDIDEASDDFGVAAFMITKTVIELMLSMLYEKEKLIMMVNLDNLEKGQ